MPKHPTKPDRYAALETYVAACLPVLNLGNWKVTILTDVAPEDRYADIEPNDQAQTANLRVGNLFWAQKPNEQRLTIVHELIHLHLCRLDQTVDRLEPVLGSAAWAPWAAVYEDVYERATDAIAEILAPQVDLPSV
jgi:hypothetical protein